jgi:hypothetical protein
MTTHRLGLLREEYETTSITIDELCLYHGVLLKELKGYKTWRKRSNIEEVDVSHLLVEDINPTTDNPVIEIVADSPVPAVTPPPRSTLPAVAEEGDVIEEIRADIKTCKKLAMARCKEFLTTDARYAEIKEIKDVVSIVNDIDKSLQVVKIADGTTVNVYINNLINNFRDDC